MSTDVSGVGKSGEPGKQLATVKPKSPKEQMDEWLAANAAVLENDPDLKGVAKEYGELALREHRDATQISPHHTPQALAAYVKVLRDANLIVSEGQYADITDGLEHLNTHNRTAKVRPGQLATIAHHYIVPEHEDEATGGSEPVVQVDFEELGQTLETLYVDNRFSFGEDRSKDIRFDQFIELLCAYPKYAGLEKKVSLDDAISEVQAQYEELLKVIPKPGSPKDIEDKVKQIYCVLFSEAMEGKEDSLHQAVALIREQWGEALKPGGFTEHDVCLMLLNYAALQPGSGFLDLESALTDINLNPLEILNRKITDIESSEDAEEEFDPTLGEEASDSDSDSSTSGTDVE